MRLRRVPESARTRMQRRYERPVVRKSRFGMEHRAQTIQMKPWRAHLELPSDFQEQLSSEGRSYWNQLSFEEQNRMIQQCGEFGESFQRTEHEAVYNTGWNRAGKVQQSGNAESWRLQTGRTSVNEPYIGRIHNSRTYCGKSGSEQRVNTTGVVNHQKAINGNAEFKIDSLDPKSQMKYNFQRDGSYQGTNNPQNLLIFASKQNKCRTQRRYLRTMSDETPARRRFRTNREASFIPGYFAVWPGSEQLRKHISGITGKKCNNWLDQSDKDWNEWLNPSESEWINRSNLSGKVEKWLVSSGKRRKVFSGKGLNGTDFYTAKEGKRQSDFIPWNTSDQNANLQTLSWKQDKRKKSASKKQNRKLNKKQLKKLISRIEYLAALAGAAKNKEDEPAQGLAFGTKLITPFVKLPFKMLWKQLKKTKLVAAFTTNLSQMTGSIMGAISAALSSMLLPLMAVALPILLVASLLVTIIPTFTLTTTASGGTSQYDAICYLTAKYESGGDASSVGEDVNYLAYGEFQFYYLYELRPFIRWCYEKDSAFYQPFEDYLNMDISHVPGAGFRNVWKQLADRNYSKFELDQEEYICTYTLEPALDRLTEKYGFDFNNASDALKGCVLSCANRSGGSIQTMSRYFDGTTRSSTEEEIINRAYQAMYDQRPSKRWDRNHEWKDCLDLLAGTLDIYEKSENDAGGIDWSWKKTDSTRIVSTTGDDIVDYALQFVGNSYVWGGDSLTGGIDCSHFVWRVLLNTGHYSGGYRTSGNWRTVGERVNGLSNAMAGDVICYDGHVAFYDGNGYVVEAKNTREGITHDEKADYMRIICIRRIR